MTLQCVKCFVQAKPLLLVRNDRVLLIAQVRGRNRRADISHVKSTGIRLSHGIQECMEDKNVRLILTIAEAPQMRPIRKATS